MSDTFDDAIDRYREKFGSLPTLMGLSRALEPRIAAALAAAVAAGTPLTDAALYEKIGATAPPLDAVI